MKPARLHSGATAEIDEAADFYNAARDGLGDEFRDAVEAAVELIRRQPRIFSPYAGHYRKCLVGKSFPHVIFFAEYDDCVWVASVFHPSRRPDSWMDRTPE